MRTPVAFLTFLFCLVSYAQTDTTATSDTVKRTLPPTFDVERRAEFPGGNNAFQQYIIDNLEYPEEAIENGVEGKVFIQFEIDKEGNVTNVQIVKTDLYQEVEIPVGKKKRKTKTIRTKIEGGTDYCLGTCASNLISNSPKWKPAIQRNKPVRMRFMIPISYEQY